MSVTVRLLAAAAGLGLASAAIPESLTVNDRVFTRDQAKNGEALYEVNCIACHDKKYFRPVLKAWEGQPLGVLFTVMAASMPQSNPGALPDKDYVDILAYILSQSRYPAGDSELSIENGALNDITIAARD